jgi:hypothetical protein
MYTKYVLKDKIKIFKLFIIILFLNYISYLLIFILKLPILYIYIV